MPRGFYRLLLAVAVSAVGSPLTVFALGLFAYREGGYAPVAGLFFFRVLARIFLAPPLATLADRVPSERVLVLGLLFRGLLTALLAMTKGFWPWAAIVFLLQGLEALTGPALSAAVARLVPEKARTRAHALLGAVTKTAALVGPALAGALFLALGAAPLFLLDAASYALAALLLLGLGPLSTPAATAAPFWQEVRLGLELLKGPLGYFFLLQAAASAFWRGLELLTLPLGPARYGLGFSLFSLGALLAQGLLALRPLPPSSRRVAGLFGAAALPFLLGLPWFLAFPLAGAAYGASGPLFSALLPRLVPHKMLARAFALGPIALALGAPAGLFLAPLLAKRLGPGAALEGMALVLLLTALFVAKRLGPGKPGPSEKP